jgi:hypothetical protein
MPGSHTIGDFLCVLAVAVGINALIGGIFLQAACALYNWLSKRVKSMSRVPAPSLGKAMRITFMITLVGALVGLLIYGLLTGYVPRQATPQLDSALVGSLIFGLLVLPLGILAEASGWEVVITAHLLSLLLSLLIIAGMNSFLLPTTFLRGLLVALCYLLVVFFVVGVLYALFGGFFLASSLLR